MIYAIKLICPSLVAPYPLISTIFYEDNAGPAWANQTSWLETTSICTWNGIRCQDGHVTEINLANNNVAGHSIAILANLLALEILNLANNAVGGALPPEINSLSQLRELYLANNNFVVNLPNLDNLTQLEVLDLSENAFSGTIDSIYSLQSIRIVNLSSNGFAGLLTNTIGNLQELTDLILDKNRFKSQLPTVIGSLSHLQTFSMAYNAFHGDIPAAIVNLPLTQFDIQFNALWADDAGVALALETMVGADWLDTQTVSPTLITVVTRGVLITVGGSGTNASLIVADEFEMRENQSRQFDVLANDTGESLSIVAVSESLYGSVAIHQNRLKYNAENGFVGDIILGYTTVDELGLVRSTQVTIHVGTTVEPISELVVAVTETSDANLLHTSMTIVTHAGQAITFDLPYSETSSSAALRLDVNEPVYGSVEVHRGATVTYNPGEFVGVDSFTYQYRLGSTIGYGVVSVIVQE